MIVFESLNVKVVLPEEVGPDTNIALLFWSEHISSQMESISICYCKMRENTIRLNTRQSAGLNDLFSLGAVSLKSDPSHACIEFDMYLACLSLG